MVSLNFELVNNGTTYHIFESVNILGPQVTGIIYGHDLDLDRWYGLFYTSSYAQYNLLQSEHIWDPLSVNVWRNLYGNRIEGDSLRYIGDLNFTDLWARPVMESTFHDCPFIIKFSEVSEITKYAIGNPETFTPYRLSWLPDGFLSGYLSVSYE